jgi:hypothetical protein
VIPDLDPALLEYASEHGWHLSVEVAVPSARHGPPHFALSAERSNGVVLGQCWGLLQTQDRAEHALLDEMREIDAALGDGFPRSPRTVPPGTPVAAHRVSGTSQPHRVVRRYGPMDL